MASSYDPFNIDVFGWDEILGEQTRGGQDPAAYLSGEDILGAVFNPQANPNFKAALARKAALSRPSTMNQPPNKAREFQFPLTQYGTPGQTVTVSATPQVHFRSEKLVINEIGSSTNGYGTTITGVTVGQRNQMPTTSGGMLSASFINTALGNGIKWDTCQPALSISVTLSFLQTCTWYCTIFGRAVL